MEKLRPIYHWLWAAGSAVFYGFPGKKIKVIAVTGTKGKSSTAEIINAIFEEAGYATALSNTIRFKIGKKSADNMHKMSMPGRFFIQRFLRKAADAKCDFVIMEITSQGALQHRNKFIDLDAFVFTNISPEHIESHGSYEKYIEAKVGIASAVKSGGTIIANGDDKESGKFLNFPVKHKIIYSIKDAEPFTIHAEGIDFTLNGKTARSPLSGLFNLYNILAAIAVARNYKISDEIIIKALGKFSEIKGRVEKIENGQNFTVVIDYAHTPDSLEKLFRHFKDQRIIAVFGCTGGGRDTWKREEMGKIADQYCDQIILTDDDSYDEDTRKIIADISKGISKRTPTTLIDRREAIREAFKRAQPGDAVLIVGKGTDPYLMGPHGTKIPWSDAKIAKEELDRLH